MLRVTQCLLFVLIASCGGLLINKLADNNGRVSKNCSNTSSLQSTKLTEVHLRPVSLKEFKQRLKSARTPYDLLRIFIDRKGLSDKNIKDLINTRTIILSSDYDKEGHPKSGDSLTHPASVPEEQIVSDDATMKANEIDKALAHYHEMSRNSLRECKYPQPEIVHVHDSEAKNFQYIPECTVVYRCRNVSGCCGNASRVCGPKSLQVISRSFFIMIRDGENVEPTPNIVINKEFINHTECECKEIKGLEGCNKDCPYPFRKMRPGLQCICDCLQDDRDCLEIKRGDKPLVENTLKCMKTGKCQAPVCYYGSFNIKTGFCTRAHGHGVRHRKSRRKNFRGR